MLATLVVKLLIGILATTVRHKSVKYSRHWKCATIWCL